MKVKINDIVRHKVTKETFLTIFTGLIDNNRKCQAKFISMKNGRILEEPKIIVTFEIECEKFDKLFNKHFFILGNITTDGGFKA